MAKEKQEDVDTLKRRGRRRLVGAVALALLAVIVLPMVFDPEPRRSVPPVSVRIPGEDDSAFAPKPAPRPPERKPEAKPAEPPAAQKKAAEETRPVEEKNPPPPRPDAAQFIVPVGTFANPKGVMDRLAAAKIPHFSEPAGNLTRVRAGPFPSREAADKAAVKLKALGLQPGAPAPKPG